MGPMPSKIPATPVSSSNAFRLKDWLFAVALVLAVFLVYQPAWHGGLIWDDDMHVTRPELRSPHGLWRTWFEVGASLQYYPLLHTAFWIEHRLWGDSVLGYHLMNLAQHAAAALLVALILRRLAVPGAYLAAAIFALHPVHVESVAWITEQKNTLSAVFYLGAMLTYLHFDRRRRPWQYALALVLFVAGMLSKTIIATLPGALLVIFWWQHGRLQWKRDVAPLIPFFVIGATLGVVTALFELKINHCVGPEFDFTRAERLLLAGRAVWFHAWKLIWPTQLLFIYPRWQINAAAWWQYLFPLGTLVLVILLWAMRHRGRAPLAAVLYFIGTLFPMLGFFNLYTFRYALVANHYQYLASLGLITLASAGIAVLLTRWQLWQRRGGYLLCLVVLAPLAILTWRQSQMYTDVLTLYQTTVDANPECWMAHHNLANVLAEHGQTDQALAHWRRALAIRSDLPEPHTSLGKVLARQGQFAAAIEHYREAVRINPQYANAQFHLGVALASTGQLGEALAQYQKTLELAPDNIDARNNAGAILLRQARFAEAIGQFEKTLAVKPDDETAHVNLGLALAAQGQLDAALAHYQRALEINPGDGEAHCHFGSLLQRIGRTDEAVAEFQRALAIDPQLVDAHLRLAAILAAGGRFGDATVHYRCVLQSRPNDVNAHNNLGAALQSSGKTAEAIAEFRNALELKPDDVAVHQNLGMALAAQGQLAEAVAHYQKTVQLKPADADLRCTLALTLYRHGQVAAAIKQLREAIRLQPAHMVSLNQLAWLLATSPDASVRNGAEAVKLAERAVELSGGREAVVLDTLAAAYAASGRFAQATKTANLAMSLASGGGDKALVEALHGRIKLYEAGKPYRETPNPQHP
jgi:protein O-mannosyl-transferase